MIKLYNTASHKVEEFKPIDVKNVKIYTCGPTVYGFQHIGNYASYIYWDLLIRTLKAEGYTVNRVLNLTDVGHLVSDGDDGEDKLEKGARRENKTVWEVAEFYIDDFLKSFRKLNLTEPTKICRATEYIEADKKVVETLLKKDFAYEISDGIYFDTSKFPDYATFARLDLDNLQKGARVEFSDEKRNASDFAVWKFIKPGEKHAMRWDFLNKPGYPGWHIECSTIIHEELGEPIDIHTGGIDHIPVHHTNEIAQTMGAFEKPLANYWLHCNFLTIDGKKISKSLGNIYVLGDLEERGFSAMDYKLWVLQGHFQTARNFSFDDLSAAKTRRLRLRNEIAKSYQKDGGDGDDVYNDVHDALRNNLNSAQALAILDEAFNRGEVFDFTFWKKIDELFGLNLIDDSPNKSSELASALKIRAEAKLQRDFAKSDQIRDELAAKNIQILDTPDGQIWQFAK